MKSVTLEEKLIPMFRNKIKSSLSPGLLRITLLVFCLLYILAISLSIGPALYIIDYDHEEGLPFVLEVFLFGTILFFVVYWALVRLSIWIFERFFRR